MSPHTILITGAGGYVGGHLLARLCGESRGLATPPRLVAHRRRAGGPAPPDGSQLRIGDLSVPADASRAVAGVDTVVHCAARTSGDNEAAFRADNVAATRNLVRAAMSAGVRRFVYLSSVAVYGLGANHRTPEGDVLPPVPDPYAESKRLAEQVVCSASMERGRAPDGAWVILRPGVVWGGPGDQRLLRAIRAGLRTRVLILPGPCRTPLPLTHVDNLCDAIELALGLSPRADAPAYNITDGADISMRAFCTRLADAMGVPGPRASVPLPVVTTGLGVAAWLVARARGGRGAALRPDTARLMNTHCTFSIQKARAELGYRPVPREHLA